MRTRARHVLSDVTDAPLDRATVLPCSKITRGRGGIVNLYDRDRADVYTSGRAHQGHPIRATPVTSAQVRKALARAARY